MIFVDRAALRSARLARYQRRLWLLELTHSRLLHFLALLLGVLLPLTFCFGADTPWVKAVELTAATTSSPPSITLQWKADTNDNFKGSNYKPSYLVRRREPGGSWGAPIPVPLGATTYRDTAVTAGVAYEYFVHKTYNNYGMSYQGHGYIRTGIALPAVHQRGKVAVVVDRTLLDPIRANLDIFEADLVGDGWEVVRVANFGRADSAAAIRSALQAQYNPTAPASSRLTAVILLGHVPVVKSGPINIDLHGNRPMPADGYYGDMTGNWGTPSGPASAPVYPRTHFPGPIQLQVGRVDFFDLPAFAGKSESQLLNEYLVKVHRYRHRLTPRTPRALIGDIFGDHGGGAYGTNSFIVFAPLVGTAAGAYTLPDTTHTATSGRFLQRISDPATPDFLWVTANGAGQVNGVNQLGLHGSGLYNTMWSSDLVRRGARGTFWMMFGSWFAEFDRRDNIMRTVIGLPDYPLTAVWAGRPYLYFHSMGIGETIGAGIRDSQNNDAVGNNDYFTPNVNTPGLDHLRCIHISLMGDPTLRLHPIPPVDSNFLTAAQSGGAVTLNWRAAPGAQGYHVYRSSTFSGPYLRLTANPITTLSFADPAPAGGAQYYMVRATALHVGPSGSYQNLSQGAFVSVAVAAPTQVAAPVFSPAPDTYRSQQAVSVTSATQGATIRYTTDGSAPTSTHGNLYSGAVTIAATTRIRAIAYRTGMTPSAVADATYAIQSATPETIWFDDALPAGASPNAGGEGWRWVSSSPAPHRGTRAHQSALASGLHEHSFAWASTPLNVGAGKTVFVWVYLDVSSPPSQLMISFKSNNWEHRAYWGANRINYGTDGTNSRRYIGPLPARGQWVRLEVRAADVGIEGHAVTGMAFSAFDGRVTWDEVGILP
jgi:hypothetical protein